jgi:hypothetical protein
MVKRPLIQIAYSLGLSARFAPPMAIERGTLIGLDRFLEIGIGNTRDWQCSLALLGETSITRNARASRTKRRAASRWSSAIVAAARPCTIRPAACQLDGFVLDLRRLRQHEGRTR